MKDILERKEMTIWDMRGNVQKTRHADPSDQYRSATGLNSPKFPDWKLWTVEHGPRAQPVEHTKACSRNPLPRVPRAHYAESARSRMSVSASELFTSVTVNEEASVIVLRNFRQLAEESIKKIGGLRFGGKVCASRSPSDRRPEIHGKTGDLRYRPTLRSGATPSRSPPIFFYRLYIPFLFSTKLGAAVTLSMSSFLKIYRRERDIFFYFSLSQLIIYKTSQHY
ncbi:hypothetical protein Y032_0017g3316 [Ancylostoma ceylanicum]|uniref:Uncharacterized protein n=1 Tax=Ancylostoma ceylanicum TaxID=53326 RepID=A0A016V538_9BILA|nr:hypothetical protein Y032_0017g3316 [Ancylostoma ceylanicum]